MKIAQNSNKIKIRISQNSDKIQIKFKSNLNQMKIKIQIKLKKTKQIELAQLYSVFCYKSSSTALGSIWIAVL